MFVQFVQVIFALNMVDAAVPSEADSIEKLKAHEEKIQRLEEEKLFLKGLLKNKQTKNVQLRGSQSHRVYVKSEKTLFSSLMAHYKNGRYNEYIAELEVFKITYPQSIYTDRLLYILSNMDYSLGRFTQSLATTNTIINEYPLSAKRPAALYTKAQIYNQLQLKVQAAKTLKLIKNQYPGSIEAKRAVYELNFLNGKKVKK